MTWLVVFSATLLLGIDLGLVTGVGFSLLVVIFRVALYVLCYTHSYMYMYLMY